jgi:hypothetical protein
MQEQDIRRLRQPNPFAGPDLGLTPEQMGAKIGEGVDQGQSEYASNLSNIETQAARRGPSAEISGAFYRNRQRATGGLLARSAETRRKSVLADAIQRRQDLYSRIYAEGAPMGQGANQYNYGQAVRGEQQASGYEAIGSLLAALAARGSGGGNYTSASTGGGWFAGAPWTGGGYSF